MATSGSISSPPVTFGNYIRLDWERIATNTTNRTSTIRYRLYLVLVTGSWVDATESFSISTMDGSSNGSRGVTYRGPGGTHLIHEYTNTVTHYDGNPVTLGAMATLRSGWTQLGTVITDFGTWTLDAMSLPTAPNTKYWVGGTGTWDNTAGSKWSTSPGGAGGASVPQPNEDVVISGAGTVTLGIDTPAVRQLTVGAPINLNGKTVTCARAQFNMQNFSLGSATINAYNSISFSTQTIDLGTGTLRVTHGSTLTIGGSPYAGGFHVSPWTTTVTAGTSLIEVNVNPGTGNSMDVVLGSHTYNIMRIIIGRASTGAVSAAISGSPTFRLLDIRSANSAAHTVNFGSPFYTSRFIAIGSSSSNKLTIGGDAGFVNFADKTDTYGQFVNMQLTDYSADRATHYIGSNSEQVGGGGWLLQDPPKISTLVDPLTTAPGSNPNWTVHPAAEHFGSLFSLTPVVAALHEGAYVIGLTPDETSFGGMMSTDTYDFTNSTFIMEVLGADGGASGGITIVLDASGLSELQRLEWENDFAPVSGSPDDVITYSLRGVTYSVSNTLTHTSNPRWVKIRMDDDTLYTSISFDGLTFTTEKSLALPDDAIYLLKSTRVSLVNTYTAAIGSINPTLASPSNANFLQFFGGL